MTRRSYLDTGVLIAAWRGLGSAGLTALEMLDDPGLLLVVSDAVWLELLPNPLHEKRRDEVAFYQAVFDRAERLPWSLDVLHLAQGLARQHRIAAMDAIHAGFAVAHSVDELVTTEKPEKPRFVLSSSRSVRFVERESHASRCPVRVAPAPTPTPARGQDRGARAPSFRPGSRNPGQGPSNQAANTEQTD